MFYVSALHLHLSLCLHKTLNKIVFHYFVFSTTPRQPIAPTDLPSGSNTTAEAEQSSALTSQSVAPPGLSTAAVKRVTADSPLEPNTLEQVIMCIRHIYVLQNLSTNLEVPLIVKNIPNFTVVPVTEHLFGVLLFWKGKGVLFVFF